MNSLKTLFMVAVLAAVAYGAYVSMTRTSGSNGDAPPAPIWPGESAGQIPGAGGPLASLPTGGAHGGVNVQMPTSPLAMPSGSGASTGAGAGFGAGTSDVAPPFSPGAGEMGPASDPRMASGPPQPYPASGHPPYATRSSVDDRPGGTAPLGPDPGLHGGAADGVRRASAESEVAATFRTFMDAVQVHLDKGQLAEAHLALSSVYDKPDLPLPMRQEAIALLDQLAGSVIYSRQHLLELPYRVRPGDDLQRIAESYNVPWQLLARINGIADPQSLQPGQELKVVRGPFSALIRPDRFELTLVLHGRYAGRFPIGIGGDAGRPEGSYTVQEKIANPAYYGPDGLTVQPGDPNNPLGQHLLDLGDGVALHGTNNPANVGRAAGRGSLFLTAQDIDDVYHILSVGSRVIIER